MRKTHLFLWQWLEWVPYESNCVDRCLVHQCNEEMNEHEWMRMPSITKFNDFIYFIRFAISSAFFPFFFFFLLCLSLFCRLRIIDTLSTAETFSTRMWMLGECWWYYDVSYNSMTMMTIISSWCRKVNSLEWFLARIFGRHVILNTSVWTCVEI